MEAGKHAEIALQAEIVAKALVEIQASPRPWSIRK